MKSKYIIIGIVLIAVIMVQFGVDFGTASGRLFKPINDFADFMGNYISPDGTFSLKKLLFPSATDISEHVQILNLWQKITDWFYNLFN